LSVARVKELKSRLEAELPHLNSCIETGFDAVGFTEEFVKKCITNHGSVSRKSKVIKDNLWGLVDIEYESLRLLDSPLMQRLRGIKQLGLSCLTYPCAEHSRFSHSLGMFNIVSRLLEIMAKRCKQIAKDGASELGNYNLWIIDDSKANYCDDLKHAAILHDIGHLPFSHISEKAITSNNSSFRCGNKPVSRILQISSAVLSKNLKLSELMTLLVVLSPRFIKYYTEYVRRNSNADAIYRVASLIAGMPPTSELRGLAEIISDKALDADKIDYINRDAMACGIPIGVDVNRLFYRSLFLHVNDEEAKRLRIGDHSTVVFALNASGLDSIEEVVHARTSLYHRVYHHQTTRNAERIFTKCFERIASTPKHRMLCDIFMLWSFDDFELLRIISRSSDSRLNELGGKILSRDLPKRAFAFGRGLLRSMMPIRHMFSFGSLWSAKNCPLKVISGELLERLTQDNNSSVDVSKIEDQILSEIKDRLLNKYLRGSNRDSLIPDIVSVLPMAFEQVKKDCIVLKNGKLSFSSINSTVDEQADAIDTYKSMGYVLGDPDCRDVIFHAARKVLSRYRRTGVLRLPINNDSCNGRSELACHGMQPIEKHMEIGTKDISPTTSMKESEEASCFYGYQEGLFFDAEAISHAIGITIDEQLEKSLISAGYYDDFPQLITVRQLHDSVRNRLPQLSKFDGQGGWQVNEETCLYFISQFPPSLRDEAQELIAKFKMFDRHELTKLLMKVIDGYKKSASCVGYITALTPNSGSRLREIAEQELKRKLEPKGWKFAALLDDVLQTASPDDIIVLCDDNMISGSQAEAQLRMWWGISKDKWPAELRGETNIYAHSLNKNKLNNINLNIAVCIGTKVAAERIRGVLRSFGVNKVGQVTYGEEFAHTSTTLSKKMKSFLREVGIDILKFSRGVPEGRKYSDKHLLEKCKNDALGYDNQIGLSVTAINVPVSTITAFWCPGMYNDRPWMPLFLRRGYFDKLVLS